MQLEIQAQTAFFFFFCSKQFYMYVCGVFFCLLLKIKISLLGSGQQNLLVIVLRFLILQFLVLSKQNKAYLST